VAEEARLESVCAPKAYRGFESRLLRKIYYRKGMSVSDIPFLYNIR